MLYAGAGLEGPACASARLSGTQGGGVVCMRANGRRPDAIAWAMSPALVDTLVHRRSQEWELRLATALSEDGQNPDYSSIHEYHEY